MAAKKCTERPRNLCSLNGAISTVGNVWGAIPILHASPGCSSQASRYTNLYYLGGYHGLVSSNAYEKEVVFGGSKRLRESIQGSLEVMDGGIYVVMTGCSMGINGDDIDGVIREFVDSPAPVVGVDVAGFRGDTYYGYQATLLAMVRALARKTGTDPYLVNLYGQVPSTDTTLRGDIEELDRIFGRIGVKLNTFFIKRDGVEQLKNSGNAALNLNISPWMNRNLDAFYERDFGIPTLHYPGMPVGPTAVAELLRQVGAQLGIRTEQIERVIDEESRYVYEYFEQLLSADGQFERHRFVLIGESNLVLGILRFFTNDHGHIPLAVILTDTVSKAGQKIIQAEADRLECGRTVDIYYENDVYEIEQIIKRYQERVTLVIGSSYDKDMAERMGVFFVPMTYPDYNHQILNKSHVGIRGCLTLIEDMYNFY